MTKDFQIVAYATESSPYISELRALNRTCKRFGYKPFFRVISDKGGWQSNTQAKANFLLLAASMYRGCPIVYLDADARITGRLELFIDCRYDFAAHWFRDTEMISACMYFRNNIGGWTDRIIREWIDENNEFKGKWDQKNLQNVVERLEPQGLNVLRLPPEYNWIDGNDPNRKPDLSERHYGPREPVVIQTQASRKYKKAGLVA